MIIHLTSTAACFLCTGNSVIKVPFRAYAESRPRIAVQLNSWTLHVVFQQRHSNHLPTRVNQLASQEIHNSPIFPIFTLFDVPPTLLYGHRRIRRRRRPNNSFIISFFFYFILPIKLFNHFFFRKVIPWIPITVFGFVKWFWT